MPLLIIWLLINIAATAFWLHKAFHSNDWISLFLYPEIHDKLEDEEVGLIGKLFIDILFVNNVTNYKVSSYPAT
jgi:hypothetical protein